MHQLRQINAPISHLSTSDASTRRNRHACEPSTDKSACSRLLCAVRPMRPCAPPGDKRREQRSIHHVQKNQPKQDSSAQTTRHQTAHATWNQAAETSPNQAAPSKKHLASLAMAHRPLSFSRDHLPLPYRSWPPSAPALVAILIVFLPSCLSEASVKAITSAQKRVTTRVASLRTIARSQTRQEKHMNTM